MQSATRILIVDSNAYMSGKICEQLYVDVCVCCISQCDSLEGAHMLYAGHPFQFIIMDALTVKISLDLFRQIRAGNPDVKILLYSTELTGSEYAMVKESALEAGADFFGDESELIYRVREELTTMNQSQLRPPAHISGNRRT